MSLYRQKKGDELMRMSHGHKLNYLLNVASRDTGCVLKMSSISGKKLTYVVGISVGQHDDDTNCLGNEVTVTCGFIHIVAF